jgi:hypothetical protein
MRKDPWVPNRQDRCTPTVLQQSFLRNLVDHRSRMLQVRVGRGRLRTARNEAENVKVQAERVESRFALELDTSRGKDNQKRSRVHEDRRRGDVRNQKEFEDM